jgi:hypothetical protein
VQDAETAYGVVFTNRGNLEIDERATAERRARRHQAG